MMSKNIERLLRNPVSFLANADTEDVAISSRIRLARNLSDFAFPTAATNSELSSTRTLISTAIEDSSILGKSAINFIPEAMEKLDQEILFERRLVSRDFLNRKSGTALYTSSNESCAIMINEEDHMRLQVLKPGFQLNKAWAKINSIDNQLSQNLDVAFNEELGFLTSCPTNIGTGMRASVMLHLPGLVLSKQINSVIQGISKLNLAVRGMFGEGTETLGNLFQISNQSTLGESEVQIIERLNSVIQKIIDHEHSTRQMLLEKERYTLFDHVGRSYGILRHAYKLSSIETFNALSAMRLGVNLKMFNSVDVATLNELLINVKPAHLQRSAQKELNKDERAIQRATFIRERLKVSEKK